MHGAGTVHAALRAGVDQGRSVCVGARGAYTIAIYTRCKISSRRELRAEAKAAAGTALSFFPPDEGFSLIHVYLRLICGAALCATGDMHGCEEHLRETMALALPRGYIIPFAEFLTAHSGLIESVSQRGNFRSRTSAFSNSGLALEELDGLPAAASPYPTPPPFSRTASTISPACWPPISPTRRRRRGSA